MRRNAWYYLIFISPLAFSLPLSSTSHLLLSLTPFSVSRPPSLSLCLPPPHLYLLLSPTPLPVSLSHCGLWAWARLRSHMTCCAVGYRLQCLGLHEAGEADVRVSETMAVYFSKLIEFLDTMFFVLRKKNSQITFLHVYHHASMFNIWWSVLNWIPCGQSFFGPTLNSFIHKRYLTQAQLVQFLLSIIHTLGAVIVPCGFPIRRLLIQVSCMATLVILFVNVYIQTYRKRRPSEDDKLTFEQSHIKSSHPNGHSASTNGTSLKKRQ
uniref:Elongation of very long chain fatty acids protein n=1 Tax=Oncorhynchus kisutch TaxID=8019 RepID=A0A8C7KNK4_ONCKI